MKFILLKVIFSTIFFYKKLMLKSFKKSKVLLAKFILKLIA